MNARNFIAPSCARDPVVESAARSRSATFECTLLDLRDSLLSSSHDFQHLPPLDTFARPLRDLRISVTDRCNFRCTYCMPREIFGHAYAFLPKNDLLTFEEIARLTKIFAGLGIEKVRLTGGEPLLRKNLERLVSQIAAIPEIRDLTLTTNGSLLGAKATALQNAGLRRLTVSLDSLDDAVFRQMNDADFSVATVLRGIEAARDVGFAPIKINAVIQRGVNEKDVVALARHFAAPEFILRFIEYMDVGNTNGWRADHVVTAAEIAVRLASETALEPLPANYPGEVARRFRTSAGGEIGIISSVSAPFCRECTRARLSSDGQLYTCLFSEHGHDLRGPLRAGANDEALATIIRKIWTARDDRYSELRAKSAPSPSRKVEMSAIGG